MSLKTWIQNRLSDRKIEQERSNAGEVAPVGRTRINPVFTVAVALTFVFLLAAIAVPAQAATINLSFLGDLFDSVSDIIPNADSFLDAAFPFAIKLAILFGIFGVVAAVIAWFEKKI